MQPSYRAASGPAASRRYRWHIACHIPDVFSGTLTLQARLAVRERSVESLLQLECETGTRLHGVVRAYGWFNEVGEKKRVPARLEINVG